jgi:hypothetical protein
MKIALVSAAAVLGFLALAIVYSTANGYTTWYVRKRHSEIFVNGRQVPGYIHESKHALIATRRDTVVPHSYLISFHRPGSVLDCGDWSAPSFPVFATGDVSPPCVVTIGNQAVYSAPEAPATTVKIIGMTMLFRTRDGKQIRFVQ